MSLTIINAELVHELLPMAECIDAMESAMIAASSGTVSIPPRSFSPVMDSSGFFGFMPGSSSELKTFGAKIISLYPDNSARGLPAIQGFVTLFDYDSGSPLALVAGAGITAIRTAAASGLATRLLAQANACSCGIFGTGVQAVSHIDAMCAVRQVEEIWVWGRDFNKAKGFAAEQAERTGHTVRATDNPARVGACDLVCTVTGSGTPVLEGAWVKPGAHINLVGAHTPTTREADSALIVKSAVYVDLLESAINEGGDIMIPLGEGAIPDDHIVGEIGQLLRGEIAGRSNAEQITLYNSLGITAQDLFAARHVYDKARSAGLGTVVDF